MSSNADRYDAQAIESKWQAEWARRGTNTFTEAQIRDAKEPFFNLMMFPYPSAEGLHIGNIYAFTGADVHGRYWRLRGKTVFEPIGFDAFGIHSENYALKVQTNPNDLIPRNVANFTRQLKRVGGMFDWNHTSIPPRLSTTSGPSGSSQLYHGGLVERRRSAVNWCPSCKRCLRTNRSLPVCATLRFPWNSAGCRSGTSRSAARRSLARQHRNARLVRTRKAQANWIGRSEGAEVDFAVLAERGRARIHDPSGHAVWRHGGARPEHPLVDAITTGAASVVDRYRDDVAKAKWSTGGREGKNGVFTGGYCVNPVNDTRIPIWIATTLMDYGTGAIMAVPGCRRARLRVGAPVRIADRAVIAGG
jgi:leucyl-tRNA synthetase